MTYKIGLFVLVTGVFALSSCKKNFRSLSKYKIEEFNKFIDPARGNVLIQSGENLYFFKDSAVGVKLLETMKGYKHSIALSPSANKAAYIDTSNNVHILNIFGNTNDRKVAKMKGAKRIHWTKQGDLYGVTENGKFVFNGTTLPTPSISVVRDTIFFTRDEFFDAVIMPDGKVIYAQHFEAREGFFTKIGDTVMVWDNTDSSFSKFGFEPKKIPRKLQVNKAGQLIGYADAIGEEAVTYVYDDEFGFNGQAIFAGQYPKLVVSKLSHIKYAHVLQDSSKLLVGNSLADLYPEYAVDDTLSFQGIGSIDDFDIQVPDGEYPQQTFSFE